ncbi:hypothetical protein [Legionella cardiaca]|uniref:BRO1 domain-containing protein n=1 Tax=Legionella cardiaca TaxID=1071983 RepID=A0ABY8AQN4_9GAMM|nr:hypothetical protein [Legionella cardiaca]WED42099.1 hypothetical protein PXX05_09160 [Legionella cardiaca]
MSKLTNLLESTRRNWEIYHTSGKVEALLANIEKFEKISERALKGILKTATSFEMTECNEVLLLVAQSYTNYAFAHIQALSSDKAQEYLSKAEQCYHYVTQYTGMLPPFSVSRELVWQNTEAELYKHKIKFQQAQMQLHFIKEQMQTPYDAREMRQALQNVTRAYSTFRQVLARSYKDQVYQQKFNLDERLQSSIAEGLEQAKALLSQIDQRELSGINSTINRNDDRNGTKEKTRRLKKHRALPPTAELDSVPEIGIAEKEKKEETPVITSQKEQSISMERDLSSIDYTATGFGLQTEEEEEVIPTDMEISTKTITPTRMELSSSPNRPEELVYLSFIASTFSPQPISQPSIPSSEPTVLSETSTLARSTFWTPLPNHERDSEEGYRLLNEWKSVYFSRLRHTVSGQEEKSLILEKLAHALLFAAIQLQRDSTLFRGQKMNPALRLAVQFFMKSTELVTTSNPAPKMEELSQAYAELLAPFINHSLGRNLEPHAYLQHLNRQIIKERLPSLISTRQDVNAIIRDTFSVLASQCTTTDYDLIKGAFYNTLTAATRRLTQKQNANMS